MSERGRNPVTGLDHCNRELAKLLSNSSYSIQVYVLDFGPLDFSKTYLIEVQIMQMMQSKSDLLKLWAATLMIMKHILFYNFSAGG